MKNKKIIYVFESDEHGAHIGASSIVAMKQYNAEWGKGFGLTGQAYAIPTVDMFGDKLSIDEINFYINKFKVYAETHPTMEFIVSKIGMDRFGMTQDESYSLLTKIEFTKNVKLI